MRLSLASLLVFFLLAPLALARPVSAGAGKAGDEDGRIRAVLEALPGMLAEHRAPLAAAARKAIGSGAPARVVRSILERSAAEKVDFLSISKFLAVLGRAAEGGLPVERLADKIHEGLSKKIPPPRIASVIWRFERRLSKAKGLADILSARGFHPLGPRDSERLILSIDYAILHGFGTDEIEDLFKKLEENPQWKDGADPAAATGVYSDLRRIGLSPGQAERILIDAMKRGEAEGLFELKEALRGMTDDAFNPGEARASIENELARGAKADDIARLLGRRLARPEPSTPAATGATEPARPGPGASGQRRPAEEVVK